MTVFLSSVATEMDHIQTEIEGQNINMNTILTQIADNASLTTQMTSIQSLLAELASAANAIQGLAQITRRRKRDTGTSCAHLKSLIEADATVMHKIEKILSKLDEIGHTGKESVDSFVDDAKTTYTTHKASSSASKANLETIYNQECTTTTLASAPELLHTTTSFR